MNLSPSSSDLVAYYTFDSTTRDSSTYGNIGTAWKGLSWVDSNFGKAANFDGVDDYFSVPDSPNVEFSNDGTTISFWTKIPLGDIGNTLYVFDKREYDPATNGLSKDYQFFVRPSTYHYASEGLFHFGSSIYEVAGVPIPDNTINYGEWDHWAIVYSGGTSTAPGKVYIYHDGVLINEGGASLKQLPVRGTGNLTIGARSDKKLFFKGQIDEFRVYDTALNEEDINYLAGKTAPEPTPTCTNECSSEGLRQYDCQDSTMRKVRQCGNYDSDSCLEWSTWTGQYCGDGRICSSGVCVDETPTPTQVCGNNIREGSEVCDGSDFWLYTSDCSTYPGFTGGILKCNTQCNGLDTSSCTTTTPIPTCGQNEFYNPSVSRCIKLSECVDGDRDNFYKSNSLCPETNLKSISRFDCNDNNGGVNPGQSEICNNIDDDCDGSVDEGLVSCQETEISISIATKKDVYKVGEVIELT